MNQKRLRRQLHYYSSKWWRGQFSPRVLRAGLCIYLSAIKRGRRYGGFCFLVDDPHDPANHDFVATISDALNFIALHDARRYKTIVRHIKVIHCNGFLRFNGSYWRLFRICSINYKRIFEREPFLDQGDRTLHHTVYFACLLIHEATHGRVCAFFVPYAAAKVIAIEKLCVREEERFLNRLYEQGIYPKVKMKPFNPAAWREFTQV